jgi:hypothetical protein
MGWVPHPSAAFRGRVGCQKRPPIAEDYFHPAHTGNGEKTWSKPSAAGFLTYELHNHPRAGVPANPKAPARPKRWHPPTPLGYSWGTRCPEPSE